MIADVWDKIAGFRTAAEGRAAGLYPYFRAFDAHEGPEAILEGRRVTMFGSNNYLGLTTHPKVREAAQDAVRRLGTSTTGSRLINGTLSLHAELEQRLAAFLGKPSALVFTTGFQVNLAVCAALLGEGDAAVIDRGVHASIYDGVRLAIARGARLVRFGHNSAASLDRHLSRLGDSHGALVIMDGVFSADGVVARLDEIVPVVRAHSARIMIDDAHGLGMLGPGGRGTAHHFGLEDEVDLLGGTFSKSLASVGGYLAGDEAVIDYVRHHATPFIFAASGAPSSVAAALAALEVLQEEPWRIQRLRSHAEYLSSRLRSLGFDVGTTETAIVPVHLGDDERTVRVWRDLLERHAVYTNPFLYPSVPPGGALIRTSCMATHDQTHLDQCLEAFGAVGRQHGLI